MIVQKSLSKQYLEKSFLQTEQEKQDTKNSGMSSQDNYIVYGKILFGVTG